MSDKTPRTSEQVYENNITTPQGEDFCRRLEKSRRKNIHRAWKFRNLMRTHRFERDRFIDQKIRLDAEFSVTENAMEHFHDEWLKAKADLAAANERAEEYRKVAEELVEAMPIIPSPAHPADENYTKWRSAKAKLEARR